MNSFYEINQEWERDRELRLLREREYKMINEMTECVFQPNIGKDKEFAFYSSGK